METTGRPRDADFVAITFENKKNKGVPEDKLSERLRVPPLRTNRPRNTRKICPNPAGKTKDPEMSYRGRWETRLCSSCQQHIWNQRRKGEYLRPTPVSE